MAEVKAQKPGAAWGEEFPLVFKAAQEATLALLLAVKNYGLFPVGHASTVNLLRSLSTNMDAFLERYGVLHLDLEKERIRFDGAVLYEEPNPDRNPAFIFFRDGILWLEFFPGIEDEEVLSFFGIVNRYKQLQDEPEGDLVTELWSAGLEHIDYEASDNLWEAEPVLEFSLLNPVAQTFVENDDAGGLYGLDLLEDVLGIGGEREKAPVAPGSGGGGGLAPAKVAGAGSGGPEGAGSAAGEGKGSGGETPAEVTPENPDALDFWAALAQVGPATQAAAGKSAGEAQTESGPEAGLRGGKAGSEDKGSAAVVQPEIPAVRRRSGRRPGPGPVRRRGRDRAGSIPSGWSQAEKRVPPREGPSPSRPEDSGVWPVMWKGNFSGATVSPLNRVMPCGRFPRRNNRPSGRWCDAMRRVTTVPRSPNCS